MTDKLILKNQKILMFGRPNTNNRTYTQEAAEHIVEKINSGNMMGMLGFQETQMTVDLTKVSHRMENARIEGEYVIADAVVLDTPEGKTLRQLVESQQNVPHSLGVNFATAGVGDLQLDGTIKDFKCISVNATSEPVSHQVD